MDFDIGSVRVASTYLVQAVARPDNAVPVQRVQVLSCALSRGRGWWEVGVVVRHGAGNTNEAVPAGISYSRQQ